MVLHLSEIEFPFDKMFCTKLVDVNFSVVEVFSPWLKAFLYVYELQGLVEIAPLI